MLKTLKALRSLFEETYEKKCSKEEKQISQISENELKELLADSEEIRQLLFENYSNIFYYYKESNLNTFDNIEGMFIESLNHAKISEQLIKKGRYQEATTLIRANYERILRILYCIKIDDLKYIEVLIKYPFPKNISYTSIEKELELNYYGGLSRIAHSNFEKKLMPIVTLNNKCEHEMFTYIKTNIHYNRKFAKRLIELNTPILADTFVKYYKYLQDKQFIPNIKDLEKEKMTPPNLLKEIKKFNENMKIIEGSLK